MTLIGPPPRAAGGNSRSGLLEDRAAEASQRRSLLEGAALAASGVPDAAFGG